MTRLFAPPSSVMLLACSFICAIILHLFMLNEFNQGLKMMKFAANQKTIFNSAMAAFMCGFFQASAIVMIELLNILVILQSERIQDVVMNFIQLAILAEFDNFIYGALPEKRLK